MADEKHQCNGAWSSAINKNDDGAFLLKVTPEGLISGKHFFDSGDPTKVCDVKGICVHPPPFHFIQLEEDRDGFHHTYFSEVVLTGNGFATKDGKRNKKPKVSAKRSKSEENDKLDGDDPWDGVKTTR